MTISRRFSPQQVVIFEACKDLVKNGAARFASPPPGRDSCPRAITRRSSSVCSTDSTTSSTSSRCLRKSIKTTTNNKTNKTNKKSVRFSLRTDQEYEVGRNSKKSSCLISPYELCDETIEQLWWSPEEQKIKSKADRKVLIDQFLSKTKDKNEKFLHLYKSCAKPKCSVSKVLTDKTNKQLLSDLAEVRGLEGFVCRASSTRRKQHMASILPGMKELNRSYQFIPEKYILKSSHTSQLLAQVFAHMDAIEAASSNQ